MAPTNTKINILVYLCTLYLLTFQCALIVLANEIPIEKVVDEIFSEKAGSAETSEQGNTNQTWPTNKCAFTLSKIYAARKIKGKVEFSYAASGILSGKTIVTYTNTENGAEMEFGFQTTIKYEKGEEASVRLDVLYPVNGKMEKKGFNIQRFLIPGICLMDLKPIPLFKLCLKLTKVIFHDKNTIELCITLRVQIRIISIINLYTKCMNLTTSPVIDNAKTITTKLQSIRELPEKQQSMMEKQNQSEDKKKYNVQYTTGSECSQEVKEENLPEDVTPSITIVGTEIFIH